MLTLALALKTKPGVCHMSLIAQEMALDIADGVYQPSAGEHVPAVANKTADVLSRRFQPEYIEDWTVPEWLQHIDEDIVEVRSKEYYRTLTAPAPQKLD